MKSHCYGVCTEDARFLPLRIGLQPNYVFLHMFFNNKNIQNCENS